ncbi:MAG: hypothetical protein CBD88_03145 [Flavobacteriales bacterium TMED228]|nr:MAG: hypothetical protein CBD88_03145 [Flavobacteriales bacterium TMED228]|tara:strand:+ start:146 stop:346 length:201 start_codon:yes stop_codon:yes gene_type:complete
MLDMFCANPVLATAKRGASTPIRERYYHPKDDSIRAYYAIDEHFEEMATAYEEKLGIKEARSRMCS